MPSKRPEKTPAKKSGKSQTSAKSSTRKSGKTGTRQTTQRSRGKRSGARGGADFSAKFGSFALGLAQGAFILGLIVLSLWLARDWLTGTNSNDRNTIAANSGTSPVKSPSATSSQPGKKPGSTLPATNSSAVTFPDTASSGKAKPGSVSSLPSSSPVAQSSALPDRTGTPPSGSPLPDSPVNSQGAAAAPLSQGTQVEINKESILPFKENVQSISEWVRRVDYALGQTSQRLGMGKEELELIGFEKRVSGKSDYTFQRLHLTLPLDSAPFVQALGENLKTFAPGAVLTQQGLGHLRVYVGGLLTHDIVIGHKDAMKEFEEDADTPSTVQATLDELMTQVPKNHKGRLAIVIDDLGANLESMRVLVGLDYPVSVAIWPYGAKARASAELAYANHLTVLVHMPMEPIRYPKAKPGPNALYTNMNLQQVRDTLRENLNKVPHAVGMNNHMGSRFTQWRQGSGEVVRAAAERSFFILDSVTHPDSVLFDEAVRQGVPAYKRHVFLDNKGTLSSILDQLRLAERVALHQGEAIAIGHPLPATLEALKLWQTRRDQRVELVLIQQLTPNRH